MFVCLVQVLGKLGQLMWACQSSEIQHRPLAGHQCADCSARAGQAIKHALNVMV